MNTQTMGLAIFSLAAVILTPISYRPTVLLLSAMAVCSWVISQAFASSPKTEITIATIENDERLSAAMDVYLQSCDQQCNPFLIDDVASQAAVDFIVLNHGLGASDADQVVKEMLQVYAKARITTLSQSAGGHEGAREWELAIARFTEANELAELWFPDKTAFLQKCIRRVERKQASRFSWIYGGAISYRDVGSLPSTHC